MVEEACQLLRPVWLLNWGTLHVFSRAICDYVLFLNNNSLFEFKVTNEMALERDAHRV